MIAEQTKKGSLPSQMLSQPYGMDRAWKNTSFLHLLIELTRHHINNCPAYRDILTASNFDVAHDTCRKLEDLPFLPASLFKYLSLSSIAPDKVKHTLTSSGTSRQTVSKIYLDNETALLQMQALASICSSFLGPERLPMLIIDQAAAIQPTAYSARAAGIQGFSLFGKYRSFALDDNLAPDLDEIAAFLEKTESRPFLLFGFTYIIWNYLLRHLEQSGKKLDFRNAVLIHGGGWKKLADQEVTDAVFRQLLKEHTGLTKIYNYYGMVEQTGSIYMQCEHQHLHCSCFSEVIMRRPADFSVCTYGEPGIIQTLSLLPRSYPGHSILTEDEGVLLGEDDCPCGRYGKYFRINRRLVNAELKGCGDVISSHR